MQRKERGEKVYGNSKYLRRIWSSEGIPCQFKYILVRKLPEPPMSEWMSKQENLQWKEVVSCMVI